MFNPFKWFSPATCHPTCGPLTPAQEKMYSLEKNDNFRWAAKTLGLRSERILTSSSLVEPSITRSLASIGEFAEVAHGSFSPQFVWSNLDKLTKEGFPLHGYDALEGSELVEGLKGSVADLRGYVAYQPKTRQLIVGFSGTSSVQQAFHDMNSFLTAHPNYQGASVHCGFWNMYCGIKPAAFDAIRKGIHDHAITGVDEIVLTGHSLGAVMSYLLAIDLLSSTSFLSSLFPSDPTLSITIQIAAFGCTRIGNDVLVSYWQDLVSKAPFWNKDISIHVKEYSVRTYNDGATCLPPYFLGFRHLSRNPLYLSHDALFRIPPEDSECNYFDIDLSASPQVSSKNNGYGTPEEIATPPSRNPRFPHGGHNYYNARDMEKLIRRMGWLELDKHGQKGWEERYLKARDLKEA